MSISPETLKIAEEAFHAFQIGLANGNWELFLEKLSEDFTFWFPTGPYKGLNVGKDKAREFFALVSKIFPEGLTLTVERITSNETTVVFEVRTEGKMMGHPYENQAAISFDIKGDKVCAYREYLGVVFRLE